VFLIYLVRLKKYSKVSSSN